MADIQSGQTFAPGDEVTDVKLNNIAGAAVILPAFLTGKSPMSVNDADAAADYLLIYDTSSGVFKKVTSNDLVFNTNALINSRTEDVSPLKDDYVLTYDTSAGTMKKVSVLNLLFHDDSYIAPIGSDLIPIYDVTQTKIKHVTLGNLVYYLPQHTAPVNGDRMVIFDSTAGGLKHVLLGGLIHFAPDLASVPEDADEFILYDSSVSAYKKVAASYLKAGMRVSQATKTAKETVTASVDAWADVAGLSVSITPLATTSKVLVRVVLHGACGSAGHVRILRGSTPIGVGDSDSGNRVEAGSGNLHNLGILWHINSVCIEWLDSPASTTAVTYKVQVYGYGTEVIVNASTQDNDEARAGRYVSTITAMEVHA